MTFNESLDASAGHTIEVIGFGRRFLAYFIDGIILWIVQLILGVCAGAVLVAMAEAGEDAAIALNLLINCVALLISVGYFVVFWATTSQTPGKMAMGIKIIGVDGTPVSWGKAFLRYIGYIVSGLVLSLGFIWIAFDSKRQGWHDKIAGTYVVRKDTHFSPTDAVTFVPSDPGSSWIWVVIVMAIFIAIPICVIAILLLLGPAVGNVFSNIIQELGTPTP